MRKLIVVFTFFFYTYSFAGEISLSANSPKHRVALLELYTSQGCSSCPPAEQWLSRLKKTGISSEQIIPLAFHVTYWDYIGWKDRYGSERYDNRQREIARYNSKGTIYTPQFVLDGNDYRIQRQFSSDVSAIVFKPSSVDLKINAKHEGGPLLSVELSADISRSTAKGVELFIALYENNLINHIEGGENEGEQLQHDYVVRQFYGPFKKTKLVRQVVSIEDGWKKQDINLVAFAQDTHTGEVLQAVSLKLGAK
jgi:hypothetical protein